jgi:hypothetical protein
VVLTARLYATARRGPVKLFRPREGLVLFFTGQETAGNAFLLFSTRRMACVAKVCRSVDSLANMTALPSGDFEAFCFGASASLFHE